MTDKPTQLECKLISVNITEASTKVTFKTENHVDMGLISYLQEKQGQYGHMLFVARELQIDDLKNLPDIKPDDGGKSLSQRLRSCLYVYWEKKGKPKGTFTRFYEHWMEGKIETIKDNLD